MAALFVETFGNVNRSDAKNRTGADLPRLLRILWTLPNTLLGCTVGILGLATGGGVQIERGCLEFYGGAVQWILRRSLTGPGTLAMTLGHSILGQTTTSLQIARNHEHVHVRQYERWGPFFIPAYLSCSFVLWLQKKDSYRDNPFEIEAYALDDTDDSTPLT